MKKNFTLYIIIWAIVVALFNVVVLVIPGWSTLEKYTWTFWIGYGVSMVALLGQLICASWALKHDNSNKLFYNISLFKISYIGLITTVVFGAIFMIVPILPAWIAAIVCSLILGINISAIIKAKVAIDVVESIDEKINDQTSFIRTKTFETESLLSRAKTDKTKSICKRIFEAFRFSDPISHKDLSIVENEIDKHFEAMRLALLDDDLDAFSCEAQEVEVLIKERNNACKVLKQKN